MPLPSNDELREMLGYASAYPWQHRAGAIHPNNDDATWVVAIVDDEDGQVCLDDDIDLMLLAPQLAEEVIRLREEIEDEIRSLRAPLCSHMPEGDELDEYLEEWEMRGYAAHILARILEGEE